MNDTLNAKIIERIDVSPGQWIIRVVPEGWHVPDFEPGQYATVGLPATAPRADTAADAVRHPARLIRRTYSIASSPRTREYLEFFLVEVADGSLTQRLVSLQRGVRLWVGPRINGHFTMKLAPQDATLVFVATGTGIAPFVSMLRTLALDGVGRPVLVLHGARTSRDLGYRDDIKRLAETIDGLRYLPVVSRPAHDPDWDGAIGHVQDVWRRRAFEDGFGQPVAPTSTHVFLCGNPAMIDGMTSLLVAEGFVPHSRRQRGQIHNERYW